MPVLVQWKWIKRTKSFLVIFHFDNDYSKPNLRTRKMRFEGKRPIYLYVPQDLVPEEDVSHPAKIRTVMTWAPSHLELALLTELLCYANVINGLSETEKKELRYKLEIMTTPVEYYADMKKELKDKIFFFGYDETWEITEKPKWVFCVELCPKYIDYLKKVLKPYIS